MSKLAFSAKIARLRLVETPSAPRVVKECAWCSKKTSAGLVDEDGDPICKKCYEL